MKIRFKEIHIKNFMSLGDVNIKLDNQGYVLVSGVNNNPVDLARSNGSGKSSIFEAIVWCLTGDTMRGNKDIVNCYSGDGANVTLLYDIDSTDYKLIRTKDDSVYKTNLLIYIDGEDKSGKGIRDSEKLLKEYLPDLTPSLIGSVIILGQGLPSRFTDNSPSGRKEVLEKLCKSDFMIEDLKERISSRKLALQSDLRSTEDKVLSTRTKLDLNRKELDSTKSLLNTYNNDTNYDNLIKDLEVALSNNEKELQSLTQQFETLDKQLNLIVIEQSQLAQKKSEVTNAIDLSYKEGIDKLREQATDISINIGTINNKLREIRNIKDVCPTCGQKLPDVHKPDVTQFETELTELTLQKQKIDSDLQSLMTKKQSEFDEAYKSFIEQETILSQKYNVTRIDRDKVAKDKDRVNNDIVTQNKYLTKYTLERQNIQTNIDNCKQKITQLEETIKCDESVLLYNNNVIEDINDRLSIISKFNTVVTRDFRGYLLQSVIEFINSKAKEYAVDIFETNLIDFVLDGNNITISYNGKQYEALSGGERQKVDLIIQFSIRDMLCQYTNFSTNLLALDEIFDNLDDLGSQKVIDLISTKLNDISSVFIISHHGNELNIPCDNELIVVKEPNGVSSIK